MGQKGDKHTNEAQLSADLLVEKLSVIDGITSKKMFGGHGIFHEGRMFAIVDSKGTCSLKTDASNEEDFRNEGAEKHGKMPYYAIPERVFNSNELTEWAKKSIAIK
ncbi:DNA transformation protein [Ekhidna lutea]|uniref:DNA transformation protein n=1 Tax=Ekhidna lutea TaxID=447679 RepID=A0A239KES3_EKHLU|nr:TfoX/Sxy family protein [Ekhidna lutea]SNT16133.1 DNA transformation protein [Ekhidna lutea]